VQSEAAFKLREAVTSQTDARIVVLELSEVHAIEGGGLGMLVFLRRWARDHNIRFLLFNPSKSVRNGLKRIRSISEFYVPSMDEMTALLVYAVSSPPRMRVMALHDPPTRGQVAPPQPTSLQAPSFPSS
jgi:anti-anti-sigma regulatory factor